MIDWLITMLAVTVVRLALIFIFFAPDTCTLLFFSGLFLIFFLWISPVLFVSGLGQPRNYTKSDFRFPRSVLRLLNQDVDMRIIAQFEKNVVAGVFLRKLWRFPQKIESVFGSKVTKKRRVVNHFFVMCKDPYVIILIWNWQNRARKSKYGLFGWTGTKMPTE